MRRSLWVAMFCSLFLTSVDATVVAPLSFEQLVNESFAVVYGRVVDVRSQWTSDRRFIESVVSIEVLKGMKGSAGDTIAFTVPGGQVGRYRNVIPGAPILNPGDLAVFFLTAHGPRLPVTTGLTQGIFRVQHDARSGDVLVVPPVVDAAGKVVRGDVRRKPAPLSVFEASVSAALRQAQAGPERSRGAVTR